MKLKYLTWIFVLLFLVVDVKAITDTTGSYSLNTPSGSGTYNGMRVLNKGSSAILLENVTLDTISSSTLIDVYNADKTLYKEMTVTGKSAYMNITLLAGQSYFIVTNNTVEDGTMAYNCGITYPILGTQINWTEGLGGGMVNSTSDTCIRNIKSVTYSNTTTSTTIEFIPPTPNNNTAQWKGLPLNISVRQYLTNGNTTINFYNLSGGLIYQVNSSANVTSLYYPSLNLTGSYMYNASTRNASQFNITGTRYINITGATLIIQTYSYTGSPVSLNNLNITELNTSTKYSYYNVYYKIVFK
jgi:hypothetical protein